MYITYSEEADCLYVGFQGSTRIIRTEPLTTDIYKNITNNGIGGFEILDISQLFGKELQKRLISLGIEGKINLIDEILPQQQTLFDIEQYL